MKQEISRQLSQILDLNVEEDEVEVPDTEFGDFAYPLIKVAKRQGKDLGELAEKVRENIELEGLQKVELEGPGYINFYFDREEIAQEILDTDISGSENRSEKIVIEHTSPNPNKPMHMGTMRCAVLGDSLARIAQYQGYDVEVQNYINDLGRQSAKTVYAYRKFGDEMEELEDEKDDYRYGILYSKAGKHIEENPDEEDRVDSIIKEIEEGENDTSKLKDRIVEGSLRGQLATSYSSNIFYDLIAFERDVITSGLLEKALDKLKQLETVYRVEEGEDEGCLVIDISEYEDELGGLKKPYKILFRSDGTATYTAKDIAFTMWKFGLIQDVFKFEEFDEQPNGQKLYSTGGQEVKDFGDADRVFNVVGKPQSYVMNVIKYCLKALDCDRESENFEHVDFKFVYLPGKVSYSGRKGNWVGKHGDAVLERCRELAMEEIDERHEELSDEDKEKIAEKVSVAAVRYFLLNFNRKKDINFSFEKALNWEGDSGPYLLYSVARAYGIIENFEHEPEFEQLSKDVEFSLLRQIDRFDDVVENSFESRDPVKIVHYLKELSEEFNSFYHECPVNDAETQEIANSRAAITGKYIGVMEKGMDLIGIETLEEM